VGERHDAPPDPIEVRVAALEHLLVDRGLVTTDALDAIVDAYEHRIGPHLGARVVARAWRDGAFRQRLLADGTAACAELGLGGAQGEVILVKENRPGIHNVVVCTLCSCYPWPLLGLPPNWYKSAPYRSRVVREPRAVLAEMGLDLPDDVEIRVWDSTAEVRYLVLPERPADTDDLDEDGLAALVPRDAMVGVALAGQP
jgi:nitrile hydratase subunit alpha